jgi:FAD dependent oxidoreductase
MDGAGHDGGRITELSARDFGGQRLRFTAGAYVDASGDASLTALAAGAVTPAPSGAWPSEYHTGAGKPSRWQAIGGDGAYGITLAQLRGIDRPNLFGAGRVLSGERTPAASARVIGTAFATGHVAAGVAAALHALGPVQPRRHPRSQFPDERRMVSAREVGGQRVPVRGNQQAGESHHLGIGGRRDGWVTSWNPAADWQDGSATAASMASRR